MSREKDIQIYEKIEKLCQKIDAYTTKVNSVKNEVKTTMYTNKVEKLIEIITRKEEIQNSAEEIISEEQIEPRMEQQNLEGESQTNEYNPYGDDFCYKDRLEKLNGDVESLLEELKNEDKLGHRNAYIINEINKFVDKKKAEELEKQMTSISQEEKGFLGIANMIKNMMKKIKEMFKRNHSPKHNKEEN